MLRNILLYYHKAREVFDKGADVLAMNELAALERIARSKLIDEDKLDEFDDIIKQAEKELEALVSAGDSETEDESAT